MLYRPFLTSLLIVTFFGVISASHRSVKHEGILDETYKAFHKINNWFKTSEERESFAQNITKYPVSSNLISNTLFGKILFSI